MQLKKNIIQICITITSHTTPTKKKSISTSQSFDLFKWCPLAPLDSHPTPLGQLAVGKAPRKTSKSTGGTFTIARHRLNRSTYTEGEKEIHQLRTRWDEWQKKPKNYLLAIIWWFIYIYIYVYTCICIFIIFYQLIRQEVMKHQQYFLGWMLLFSLFLYVLVLEGFQCVIGLSIGRLGPMSGKSVVKNTWGWWMISDQCELVVYCLENVVYD